MNSIGRFLPIDFAVVATIFSGFAGAPALAQAPAAEKTAPSAVVTEHKSISLALATELANTALQTCAANGDKVSVSVVDASGAILIALRADGARPVLLDFSRRKAFTAATTRRRTSELGELAKKNPDSPDIPKGENFILLSGGVPIVVDGATIGAVGVGGAPVSADDERCAEVGIAQVADRLK